MQTNLVINNRPIASENEIMRDILTNKLTKKNTINVEYFSKTFIILWIYIPQDIHYQI